MINWQKSLFLSWSRGIKFMVKICHVTSAHKTNDVRVFQKECVSLANNDDFQVYLVGSGESRREKNVEVIGIGNPAKSRLKRATEHAKKVVNTAYDLNADIYHIHDPELLLYVKKLKQNGAAVVFDSHEDYKQQILTRSYIPYKLRKIVSDIYKMIEDHACKALDAAIVPCPVDGKHIFDGRVRDCVYINNLPIIENIGAYKHESQENNTVCYTGSISRARGIDNLIKACHMSNALLILAGQFESDEYRADVQSREEYQCVDYRGYCTKDEIIDIYNETAVGANVLLNIGQYSNAQNLSTKVYEYMMMGIPFVINNAPYNVNFLKKHPCGISVDPLKVNEIAEAIQSLFHNKELYTSMSRIGKETVFQELNWKKEEEKLFALYYRLIKEKKKDEVK